MEKIEYAVEEERSIGGWYTGEWEEIGRTESKSIAESDVNRLNKRNGYHYRVREIHLHCGETHETNCAKLMRGVIW